MKFTVIVLLALLPAAVLPASYFKCKDDKGQTVFSDTACATRERERIVVEDTRPSSSATGHSDWQQRQLSAEERAYRSKRERLMRDLSGTQVSPNQSIGRMLENKSKRKALEREIQLLDQGYLSQRDPAAARRLADQQRVTDLESKVKRLEKKNKRQAEEPVQLHERFGKVYDSQGRRCKKRYDTWTCQ